MSDEVGVYPGPRHRRQKPVLVRDHCRSWCYALDGILPIESRLDVLRILRIYSLSVGRYHAYNLPSKIGKRMWIPEPNHVIEIQDI